MSTLTARETSTRLATLPRVNLLPPEVEERQRFRRVQIGLGLAVVGAVAVVGALALLANGQVADAQAELDAETARTSTLEAQVATYAEVPLVYSQVEAGKAQLSLAMGQEVRWSYFLNDLSLQTPSKVWLTSMTVTQTVDGAVDPLAAASTGYLVQGVGSVTFEGRGLAHNDVAAWLDALAKQKGLTQPYFTSSKEELIGVEKVVTFSSQAAVTEDAFSGRYTDKAGS